MVGGKQRRYYRATPAGRAALVTDPIVERAARAQQGVPAQEGGGFTK